MKLNFSIRYKTPFGQSMHVCIRYIDVENHERESNLLMRTDDGLTWLAETSGIVVTHEPIRYFVYRYQVEDDHGKVMRREWSGVPRIYSLDATRKYIFQDIWRDLSLQHYIFPVKQKRKIVKIEAMPYFTRSVIFRVSAPQVREGSSVAILGSKAALGVWNEKRYLPMHYIGDGDWMLSINASAMEFPFEFKYVVVDNKTHDIVEWESGGNRKACVKRLEDGEQLIIYGGNVRSKCALDFHDELMDEDHALEHEIPELYI